MASFKEMTLNVYSNFMKFLFSNLFLNIILITIENSPNLIMIDYMIGPDVLSKFFSPIYFISPTTGLELVNERFSNECELKLSTEQPTLLLFNTVMTRILQDDTTGTSSNTSSSTPTDKPSYLEIKFFDNTILTLQTTFCLYSKFFIYLVFAAVSLTVISFIVLGLIDNRKQKGYFVKIIIYVLTNLINLMLRPFSILAFIVLLNKPILFLYKNNYIKPEYFSNEVLMTIFSIIFLVILCITISIFNKYINNAFYFEKFPFDYYSQNDAMMLFIIKLLIAFYFNFEKLIGIDRVSYIGLFLGVSFFFRGMYCILDRKYVVNNVGLKIYSNFLGMFFPFYIILKLINQNFIETQDRFALTLITELLLIVILTIALKPIFIKQDEKFSFQKNSEFFSECLHFLYYVDKNFQNKQMNSKNKSKTDNFLDNIIIGHKMKCCLENCIFCPEDIYNPDMKTFVLILYQQFLKLEKEVKEKDGEMSYVLKLLFLKVLDEKKIHRISFNVLTISKEVGWETYLKINYLYQNMLDEINKDLKNLITIKYSETYDDLFKCISDFEDIITYVKCRTEKVEIVINKTNQIGLSYDNIIKDLLFLKKNKRIFFDSYNLQQLLCLIKLIFDREIHPDLAENLEQNFADFLENIDAIYDENRIFMVRYDFSNSVWKIKKVPMVFLEFTKFKASELIENNIEKIFPHFIGRMIIKKFQELMLSSVMDHKLIFKTYVCDAQKNARYVKFIIDVIPNFENNYILLMDCHFHKRNVLIVDEFGNLINGSEELYNKGGLNSEAIAASRGKLNIHSVFNVPKNIKLEEVKCLNISDQFILNTAKNVFLVEPENPAVVPKFLSNIIKDESKKKKNEKIYIQVYETMIVNDVKYIVYYFRLDRKTQKFQEEKVKTLIKQTIGEKTGTVKKESFSSSVMSDNIDNNRKTLKKFNKKTLFDADEDSKKEEINYFDYYNLYYDTNHSASVTLNNYKKTSAHSVHSQNLSTNSDLFSFLYFKNSLNKKRSKKFVNFLNMIYLFNFFLVFVSLIIIFYMLGYSNYFKDYLVNYRLFNKVRSRIYSSTSIYLSMVMANQSETYDLHNSYIMENFYKDDESSFNLNLDSLIKENLKFHAENILVDLNELEKSTYTYFGSSAYNTNINFKINLIFFNSIGNYFIRQDDFKNALDLFALTSFELSNTPYNKIFFNVSYLNFDPVNKNVLKDINTSLLSVEDFNYFQSNINLYQYLYNYFSVYKINLQKIQEFFTNFWQDIINSLHTQSKALLIGIIILHVIFVLVSFSSIFVFKKILLQEFNTLYSINEDHINKLNDKFKNIKGLIKSEQMPSKIYQEIRKLKEVEAMSLEKKKNIKKSDNQNKFTSETSMNTFKKANSIEDEKSVLGEYDPYLKFAGAKAALVRSSTLKIQNKIDKIKRETKQVQASNMLLQRLNFKFDLVNKFVFFIAFMCLFYISTGILIVYLLDNNITEVITVFKHSDSVYEKSAMMFNFYNAVKLSMIFNKFSPYTHDDEIYNPSCKFCAIEFLGGFSEIRDEISRMQADFSYLQKFYDYEGDLNSEKICTNLYSNDNDFYSYIKNSTNPEIITEITNFCTKIPIMKSNSDSIMAFINIKVREAFEKFTLNMGTDQLQERIKILQDDLIGVDILFTIFAEPYFSYIKNTLVVNSTNSTINQYFTYNIIIFVLNLLIDILMLIYVWIEIYKKIISSVNNIHLVTDSVSTI